MSARDKLIRRLSEDSLGGIATLHDVTAAEQLVDAHRAEVIAEHRPDALRLAGDVLLAEFRHPEQQPGLLGHVETLHRLADEAGQEKDTPTGEATPDFFQPGRTYTVNAPFMAPEIRASFQCIAVAIHPTASNRRALGFEQEGAGSPWRSSSMRDEEWADGWVDITEGGAPDA